MKSFFQGLSRWFTRAWLRTPVIALLLLSPGSGALMSRAWAQTESENIEILTRGPVHEAFAATINFKATERVMAPQAPPKAIQEIPPDQRPEGDNVTWISGYWAWDEETNEFLWVSGIWRNLPPGRQWIPGYWWEASQGGHQWISGYWADGESDEVEYLSEPPASLEAGPNVAAPSRSHKWIPGTWRWSESQYAWQPGYWNEAQPDWVWVPPYYSRAPQGWLYVDGYYDYDVPRRGLVFAPVRFTSSSYARPDYFYRPSTVISLSVFAHHLFLRPRNHHYYFGDYYAPQYRESGYYASSNYYSGGYGYDPIYAHQRWTHRDDDRWESRSEEDFAYYRDNESARPPHTLAALSAFLARSDQNRRVETDYATQLDQLADRRDSPVRIRRLGEAEQKKFAERGREIREFGDLRRNLGRTGTDASPEGKRDNNDAAKRKSDGKKSVKVKMPKSPVMAQAAAGDNSPPARPHSHASEEKSGAKSDPDSSRKIPDDRAEKKGRGTPKRGPVPDPPAEPADPRRGGRSEEPKADRKNPSAKDRPQLEPKDPVRKTPEPESRKPAKKDAKPDRGSRTPPQKEARRQSDPPVSNGREPRPRGDQTPEPEQKRRVPAPQAKTEPNHEPRKEPKRENKAEPKRGSRAEPKGGPKPSQQEAPKREPRVEPKRQSKPAPAESKREPKAETRKDSQVPSRKEPKAAPRPQPKAPAPKAEQAKKETPQPNEEKEKKKGDKD